MAKIELKGTAIYGKTATDLVDLPIRVSDNGDGTGSLATSFTPSGTQDVQGSVASGAANTANPVKIGGAYNSTLPTFTTGQAGDVQIGTRGSLAVTLFQQNSTNAISTLGDNSDAVAVVGTTNKLAVINRNTVYNGTTWDRMLGNATDGLTVNLGTNNDVTVTSSALPSGAATETTLAGVTTQLTTDVNVSPTTAFSADNVTSDVFRSGTGVWDGTGWDRTPGNSTDGMKVNLGADNDVTVTSGNIVATNAGTFVVQESGAALTSLQLIDDTIATTASAIPTKGVAISGTDGTLARIIKTDATGIVQIAGTVTSNTTSATAGVHSNPNITTASTLILTSNGSRKAALVRSPRAAGTETCYLSFDGSATTSDVEFGRGETLSIANYTGTIHAITASGSVTLQVVEF